MTRPLKGKISTAPANARWSESTAGQMARVISAEKKLPGRWAAAAVCVLLGTAVWLVFGQTLGFDFVNYDNGIYIYENPNITAGLSLKGIIWAFTHVHVDEWWPLNSISHMLDCEIFGLFAGGHHLTNVLLHTATVILLFLVLRNMTGAFWRSAFVAAIFAIHPLRVESVAWVTERKDVLSGLFFVLTLGAYVRYVRRPFAVGRYLTVLLFFTLGMLSKSMLVTMPFVMLLLDYWPLRRFGGTERRESSEAVPCSGLSGGPSLWGLLIEKVPFLLVAAAGSVTTILAEGKAYPVEYLSIPWRIANALVAYATYLKQLFYPAGLAVFYPHPENHLSFGLVGGSALLLFIITLVAAVDWRKRPFLLVGWLWYLGMLVPVIGLLQVGAQSHADRYTYLPQIGLYILIAWAVAELCGAWRYRRSVLSVSAVVILLACGVRAHDQTKIWRDSISLWEHTLAHTSGNYVAHFNLGSSLADKGKVEEAIAHYREAIRIKPTYAEAYYNWGVALGRQGKLKEAFARYERAIELKPFYPDALNNFGNAMSAEGRVSDAIQLYERALRLKPNFPEAYYNLGIALTKMGKSKQAIERYEQALRLNPNYVDAHYNLANRLAAQGKLDDAVRHLEQVVRIRPGYVEAYNNLGNKFAAQKKWDRAVQSYERALQLRPDYAEAHNNLGVALADQGIEGIYHYKEANRLKPDYAEAQANLGNALAMQGKTDEALEHLYEALNLATAQTNAALARAIVQRLESYQSPLPEAKVP